MIVDDKVNERQKVVLQSVSAIVWPWYVMFYDLHEIDRDHANIHKLNLKPKKYNLKTELSTNVLLNPSFNDNKIEQFPLFVPTRSKLDLKDHDDNSIKNQVTGFHKQFFRDAMQCQYLGKVPSYQKSKLDLKKPTTFVFSERKGILEIRNAFDIMAMNDDMLNSFRPYFREDQHFFDEKPIETKTDVLKERKNQPVYWQYRKIGLKI
jgi:hypothetical protein